MDRQIAATEWDFKFRKSPPSDQHLAATKMAFGFRGLQSTDLAFFHSTKPHFKAFGPDPRAPRGQKNWQMSLHGAVVVIIVVVGGRKGRHGSREQGAMTFRIPPPKMVEKGHFGWK